MSAGAGGVTIGTAIVSYIEPHPGHEAAFNRWYERDHFPATVRAGPGVFAGARYVATRACKAARPRAGTLLGDPARGSYLALAWVLPGHQDEWDTWVTREMETIAAAGRLFGHRDHVHTGIYRCTSEPGPAEVVALDRAHAGVVVVADAGRVPPLGLAGPEVRLRAERTVLSGAQPPPHELAVVFCDADPLAAFARLPAGAARAGFASPFLATVPGTDTYADDL